MIKYADAQRAFAHAIYDLLSTSESAEWFSITEIAAKSGVKVGSAFVSRILTLSGEEDDVFISFNDDGEELWSLGKEGFDLIEASLSVSQATTGQSAPASDRVVQFNHNAPDALDISSGLSAIAESVRGANGPEVDEQERTRVYNALTIAKQVWDTGHFKLIQLKIGILLAVEDAVVLLAKAAKHVAAALLVDAIKAFAKNHFNTDLDAI